MIHASLHMGLRFLLGASCDFDVGFGCFRPGAFSGQAEDLIELRSVSSLGFIHRGVNEASDFVAREGTIGASLLRELDFVPFDQHSATGFPGDSRDTRHDSGFAAATVGGFAVKHCHDRRCILHRRSAAASPCGLHRGSVRQGSQFLDLPQPLY